MVTEIRARLVNGSQSNSPQGLTSNEPDQAPPNFNLATALSNGSDASSPPAPLDIDLAAALSNTVALLAAAVLGPSTDAIYSPLPAREITVSALPRSWAVTAVLRPVAARGGRSAG